MALPSLSRMAYFYPRPPRGGRRRARSCACRCDTISIHALREEGDRLLPGTAAVPNHFYPRPPRGGRLLLLLGVPADGLISIHALREEGDSVTHFRFGWFVLFLSTPSARRATPRVVALSAFAANFYPRPPRGGRRAQRDHRRHLHYFYPRPPRGGRQQKQRQNLYFQTNYTTFCTNLEEL